MKYQVKKLAHHRPTGQIIPVGELIDLSHLTSTEVATLIKQGVIATPEKPPKKVKEQTNE